MKRICMQHLIIVPHIESFSRDDIRHDVFATLELPRHILCWAMVDLEFGIV